VRRSIGLWVIAFGVWQAGCSGRDERPKYASRPDAGVVRDAGKAGDAGEPDGGPPDAADDRGETPEWPEAEQEIELPFGGPEASVVFVVTASPSALDVHLNVDTTSSMGPAIDELQFALKSTVIDRLRTRVKDVAFGVSRFADFPVVPYGFPGDDGEENGDQAFVLMSPITTNFDRVLRGVNLLDQPLGSGGDNPEASAEALYQIATGVGYTAGPRRFIERKPATAAAGGGTLGGVGFRDFALHVVLHVTDAPAHTPDEYAEGDLKGLHSMKDASAALGQLGARVVSILSTGCEAEYCRYTYQYKPIRDELEMLALNSGASFAAERGECKTGIAQTALPAVEGHCPLVYDVRSDGSGLSRTISDGVLALLEEVRFDEVHADTSNDRLHFITDVRTEPAKQPSGVPAPIPRDRLPSEKPDGVPESYVEVDRRSLLGFRVTLQNQTIAPRDVPQRFRVAVEVVGDSVRLEERLLRVVVPALATGE
jgi:hypothetical protein